MTNNRASAEDGATHREHRAESGSAERRVELLSAFARGIICEFDSECRYRDVWATDERLLAMPSQQLIGRTIAEALGEEVGRPLMNGTARVFQTGTPETHEYTLSLAMGRRAFEARIVRIRTDGGPEPYRAAALIRDVTDQKEVEGKLAEAERLAALGVLAAGIGHEINNPLMVVGENARMVSRAMHAQSQLPAGAPLAANVPSLLQMLEDILDGVGRMQRIVADLRLFSRDGGEDLAPLDARSSLTAAVELARTQVEQRAVLELSLSPVPLVLASDGKLGQVFLNLLINATQAIAEGDANGQRIRVSTGIDERGWAVVEIADTGRGIPPEEVNEIFDPFFTTKREGMGLGLSICQRIISGYGGTIKVESEVGKGTKFRVLLPPHTAELLPDRPAAQTSEPLVLLRLRLLVIDDEPALLRTFAISLGDEHSLVMVDGCEAALRVLGRDGRFDGILCDLMMPRGDGMTFYEQLGHVRPALQAKVVFMTGGAFTARARSFLDSIPNRTLTKPFTHQALRSVLAELVRGRQ